MKGEQDMGGEGVARFYVLMANDLQKRVNKMRPEDDLRGVVFDVVQMFKEYVGAHEKERKDR